MIKSLGKMSSEKRNIILTFDHELFLGEKSGTPENCMITPYKELKSIFSEYQVRNAVFFLDTTYLMRLELEIEKGNIDQDRYDLMKDHFKEILDDGHYIFPHIHPHWLDAELLSSGMWRLTDFSKYCFKNCTEEQQKIIWEDSIRILKELGVEKYHKIDAFRAGGWGIQPFSNFKPFFSQYGLKYDMSVMPGLFGYTDAQQYDFTNVKWKPKYTFSDSVTEEEINGQFIEMPISTRDKTKNTLVERLLLKYHWKTGIRSFGDGIGAVPKQLDYTPEKQVKGLDMVSIELMNAANLKTHLRLLKDTTTVQFLSHPKMLTKHSVKTLGRFLAHSKKNYSVNFDFRNVE